MGFLDIGVWEIILILIIALIIWGPGKIPEIGRTLGKILRVLKKAAFDFTSELTKEADEEEKNPETTESATIGRPPHRGNNE